MGLKQHARPVSLDQPVVTPEVLLQDLLFRIVPLEASLQGPQNTILIRNFITFIT